MSESMARFRSRFGENIYRSIDQRYYQWKLFENPFQKGFLYLEDKDGGTLGSTSITPKRIGVFGEAMPAAEIGDTFTHPDHRRQGVFSRGVKAGAEYALAHGIKIIYGTPNALSLPGYEQKLGFPSCARVRVRMLTKDLKLSRMAKRLMRNKLSRGHVKSLVTQFRFGRTTSAIADSGPFELVKLESIDEELDGLWGKPRYAFFTLRDRTYLNWRFFQGPDHFELIMARSSGENLGYLVTKIYQDGRLGLICDFVTRDDRQDVFIRLLGEAESRLKSKGVENIELRCTEEAPYFASLLKAGYLNHGNAAPIPVIVYSGSEAGKSLLDAAMPWHFTMADSDKV